MGSGLQKTLIILLDDLGIGRHSPMLWKLPPPTSPFDIFVFPFPLVFFRTSVPPFTFLFAIEFWMNSVSSSSFSSSWGSVLAFLPVSAEDISISSSERGTSCEEDAPESDSSSLCCVLLRLWASILGKNKARENGKFCWSFVKNKAKIKDA